MKPAAFLIAIFSCVVAGCSRPAGVPSPARGPERQEQFTHRIRRGETLGSIAQWYTGDAENWRKLAELNPELQAKRLKPGQHVEIPKALMTKSDPMPERRVAKKRRQAVVQVAAKSPAPESRSMMAPAEAVPPMSLEDEIVRDRLQDALLRGPSK